MNLTDIRRGLVSTDTHFRAFPNQYTDEAHKVLSVGSMLNGDALDCFTSTLEDNKDLCLNYDEFKGQLLEVTTPKGTRIQALIKLLALEQCNFPLDDYITHFQSLREASGVDNKLCALYF
ncbi:hypothetical protein DSO57_1006776 [Entomophthora muscae]|uniref:Uncharacterized protein n=1 Tax=Entomophthora muscae TaxID=34485 RepID=A0ACC2S9N0_9FUNG|nr:hypothetical protein DSO57_1006776 [Entomophthora muscae]